MKSSLMPYPARRLPLHPPRHACTPAFALPLLHAAQHRTQPSLSRRPSQPCPSPPSQTSPASNPTRLQLARLRLHLLRAARADPSPDAESSPGATSAAPRRARSFTPEQRRTHANHMRAKWADPHWRAAMLERRRDPDSVHRMRDAARRLWRDPAHRARMRASRMGRAAPNKDKPASLLTRMRMSAARRGLPKSEETRRRMSMAKMNRSDTDDWPRLISEGKRGKTKEYFRLRREFRALHRDLKLWSDSYRARHGRLPGASTYEQMVAPMMVFRVRRYLTLRDAIGNDEPEVKGEIISRH